MGGTGIRRARSPVYIDTSLGTFVDGGNQAPYECRVPHLILRCGKGIDPMSEKRDMRHPYCACVMMYLRSVIWL